MFFFVLPRYLRSQHDVNYAVTMANFLFVSPSSKFALHQQIL